jgi:ATP/maltotriose-dependent transcriptional regulator MalT
MTRLVADGAVFPLGMEDLRFTPDETRELRAALGGDDSRDEHAEGWVAGILLGGAPRQLGVGGGSLLSTYVEREVLKRLTSVEQEWLEMLSVLEVITPSMAERILGSGPWSARLLSLTARCAFLVAGDDGSYRLHALIRETLLNRLRRRDDGRAARAWKQPTTRSPSYAPARSSARPNARWTPFVARRPKPCRRAAGRSCSTPPRSCPRRFAASTRSCR